ncbi:MAG: serpin family protein [Bacteroidales bacterium]|nr:serpin family protein [Bacteroidales bacterium]
MKKSSLFPILPIIAACLTFSCEKTDPVEKEIPKITLHKKAAEIIQADNAFGFELFKELCQLAEGQNLMISPLSVSYALGMTYNGAEGATLQAFNEVLHFSGLSTEEVNENYKDLMDQLLVLDDQVEFALANSIWYRQGFQVFPGFIAVNRDYFDAVVEEVDFTDPATVDIINQWIEDKTNNKIQDMLDEIPDYAVMYLINAIYFNATWKYEFEKTETREGEFTLSDLSPHQVDYMHVEGNFQYISNNDFTAVELPYGDSAFSMLVMLPSDGKNVDELTGLLDIGKWNDWFESSLYTGVHVELPKFKYEFKELLNIPLKNLGLGIAFSDTADFSKITSSMQIFISRVIHQTFIDVQEEGTEAAAATIVEMRNLSTQGGGSPIYFKADRPFLYLIKENSTGAIVFMGKVEKPEYQE